MNFRKGRSSPNDHAAQARRALSPVGSAGDSRLPDPSAVLPLRRPAGDTAHDHDRALCGVLDAALQGSGAEKHAARLVRADYLASSEDEDDAAPTPAAERQRRHRDRRRAGIFVVPVQVTSEMVEALCRRGDVDEDDSSDLERVGEAIAAAARRGLGSI